MVFGKVVKGKEVLHKLVDYHLNNGITIKDKVLIYNCGEYLIEDIKDPFDK